MSEVLPEAVTAIQWTGKQLKLLDQRQLPLRENYLSLETAGDVAEAIRAMVVRGAPAIGVAAAFGLVLDARRAHEEGGAIDEMVHDAADCLGAARPTAVNLRWALDRMLARLDTSASLPPEQRIGKLEAEALRIRDEDVEINRAIGRHGAPLLLSCTGVLTHCNTGSLATAGVGTALGMIRQAHQDGARFMVFAGETRPYLQGSRLTAWELKRDGIPVTLLVDSAAALLMARGKVQALVVGADRIAANGDVANKIGTYSLALLASAHKIPFYVAAPTSTLDPGLPDGRAIPLEMRDAAEVIQVGGRQVGTEGVEVFNPAFDVTPAGLVSAIVTETGVLRAPFEAAIRSAYALGQLSSSNPV